MTASSSLALLLALAAAPGASGAAADRGGSEAQAWCSEALRGARNCRATPEEACAAIADQSPWAAGVVVSVTPGEDPSTRVCEIAFHHDDTLPSRYLLVRSRNR